MRKYDEVQALLKRLRDYENCTDTDIDDAANEIEELTKLLEKQQQIIRRVYVEHFPNTWFPTGGLGEKDRNGLPEYVEICPAYGAGFTVLYKKTDREIPTEGG